MSFESLNEAYRSLRARTPKDVDNLSKEDVFTFVSAAGTFGRALAAAGLYAELQEEAEWFVEWMDAQMRSEHDCSLETWTFYFLPNEQASLTITLTPLLSKSCYLNVTLRDYIVEKIKPNVSEVLGYYLLHLCSIARDASKKEPRFFEQLADCFLLVGSQSFELVLRAAYILCYPARSQPLVLTVPVDHSERDTVSHEESTDIVGVMDETQMGLRDEGTGHESAVPLIGIDECVVNDNVVSSGNERCQQPSIQSTPSSVSGARPQLAGPIGEGESQAVGAETACENPSTEGRYLAEHEEPSDKYYRDDYLEGTKKDLSLALNTESKNGNPKVVDRAVASGLVAVRKISAQTWQMFFLSEARLERGRKQRDDRKQAKKG